MISSLFAQRNACCAWRFKASTSASFAPTISNVGACTDGSAAPAVAAQGICDRLVAAGVTSILNFAPTVLNVPDGVDVRKVDLSIELQILAFHAQRRMAVKAPYCAEPEVVEAVGT